MKKKRSLQNHRTRIHKNLFAAIGIQVIIRMTLYLDQAVFVSEMVGGGSHQTLIDSSTVAAAGARGIHETVNKFLMPSKICSFPFLLIINAITSSNDDAMP
jgi:hypothetical protein